MEENTEYQSLTRRNQARCQELLENQVKLMICCIHTRIQQL